MSAALETTNNALSGIWSQVVEAPALAGTGLWPERYEPTRPGEPKTRAGPIGGQVEWLGIDEAALDRRIRERAYRLWQEQGCPEGRADAHWELAKEIIAIEDAQHTTLRPVEPPGPEPI